MKYVLDFKDFCQKAPHSDEKNYNEQFYRYNIMDEEKVVAVVWFAQMVDSGNIYTVSVSIQDEVVREICEIFVQCDLPRDTYYPSNFQMSLWSKRLNTENFDDFKMALDAGYEIANTVMTIFSSPEHLNPYKEARK